MSQIFKDLEGIIAERQREDDPGSYTCRLLNEKTLVERKLNEEAYEVIEAAFKGERNEILSESCDLLFHFLVFLRKYGISLDEIENELLKRRKEK